MHAVKLSAATRRPRFPEAAEDFADPLYNWVCMLFNMHEHKLTPTEVLKMEPKLQTFYEQDAGLQQFCERYGFAVATDKVREDYNHWYRGVMRDWGEMEGAKREGIEIGRTEGIAIGKTEGIEIGKTQTLNSVAITMLKMGLPSTDICEVTGIAEEELEQLAESEGIELAPQNYPTMSS